MAKTWCVLANDGIWCAGVEDKKPDEAATSIETLCRSHITLPHGFARKVPTCPSCREMMVANLVEPAASLQ